MSRHRYSHGGSYQLNFEGKYLDVPACTNFSREVGTFQFQNPITGFVNAATREFSGMMANLSYSFELADLVSSMDGGVTMGVNYYHVKSHSQTVGGFDLNEFQGEDGNINHQWVANLGYAVDRVNILLQWQHQGAGINSSEDAEDAKQYWGFEAWNVFNLTLGYQISDTARVQFVVNNLMDKFDTPRQQGRFGSNGATFYDPIDRRFLVKLSADF